jgi:ABC-type transporter Mla subunit MlaD
VVADLEQAAKDLGTAVHEVTRIERQLNHISINATASAIHVGTRGGAALKVIAGAIRELRAESAARSGGAGAVLDSIGGAIHSLAAKDDASGASLVKNLDARVQGLQSAGQAGGRTAARVAALAGSLRGDLQQVRDRFAAGRLFAQTVHRCCESLQGVASAAEPHDSSAPIAGAMEHLYTMDAQRNTHLAVLGALPAGPAEEDSGHVEFF